MAKKRSRAIMLAATLALSYAVQTHGQEKVEEELSLIDQNPQTILEVYKTIGLSNKDISNYNKYVESPAIKYRQSSQYKDNPAAVLAIFEPNEKRRYELYKAAGLYEQLMEKLERDLFQQTIAATPGSHQKKPQTNKGIVVPTDCEENCVGAIRLAAGFAKISEVKIYFGDRTHEEITSLAQKAGIDPALVQRTIWLMDQMPEKTRPVGIWFDEKK